MSTLTHPATGHQVKTDDESVEFWTLAGYRADKAQAPAKKAAAKRTSSAKK